MNSYFSQLYLDLQQRIKSQVEKIAWIEQDFGQETGDRYRAKVAFPAVLIDFPSADYDNIATGGQTAAVTVSVRLLVAPFSQSYGSAPEEVKEKALEYLELEQELTAALHGRAPSPVERAGGEAYTQPLMRTRRTAANRNDTGLRIIELQFTAAYEEYKEIKGNRARI
jgi:hypothetical protein